MTGRLAMLALACLLTAPVIHAAAPDYDDLDAVLLRNVRDGFVDYDGINADPAFTRFVTDLDGTREADLEDREQRLAFFINAYNALAIRGILDGYSPSSLLGRYRFFRGLQFEVLGGSMTLDELEHEYLAKLGDERVHFAIVCASMSCPRLSNRAYLPATVNAQLDVAARAFVVDGTRNRFDTGRRLAYLSRIFDWYSADFARASGSVQAYLARYAPDPEIARLLAAGEFTVSHLEYDWDLNGIFRRRDAAR